MELRKTLEKRNKQESERRQRELKNEEELKQTRRKRAAERQAKIRAMKTKSDTFRRLQLKEHEKRIQEMNDRETRLGQKKKAKQLLLEQESKSRQRAARERLQAVKYKMQKSKMMKERIFRERETRIKERQMQRIREKELQEKQKQQKEREKLDTQRKIQLAKLKEELDRKALMEKKYDEKRSQINKKLSLDRLEKERQALISKLHLEDKQHRAIAAQRRDAYEQQVRISRLEEQSRKTEILLSKREELQKARRLANEQASIERRKMSSAVALQT